MHTISARHRMPLFLLAAMALTPICTVPAGAQETRPSLIITSEPEPAPVPVAVPGGIPVAHPIAAAPVPRAPAAADMGEPVIPMFNESSISPPPPGEEERAPATAAISAAPVPVAVPAATGGVYPRPASASSAVPEDSAYPQQPVPQLALPDAQADVPPGRPLVKVRFDQQNVQYDKAVNDAVSAALKKYPDARFYLYSVFPGGGNAAKLTIESARARRNAESILRSLQQNGIDAERFDLKTVQRADAPGNEVTILIK